jgi:gluconate 5-dehydrogenase
MCRALAEAGASVVVGSRDPGRARAAAAALPVQAGSRHHGVALDHMDEDSLAEGFRAAVAAANGLDILVNNGLEGSAHDLADVSYAEFARHQANNAGYFVLARHMRDHAVGRGIGASIIMIGSMYAVVGSYPDAYEGVHPASPVAYHALKGGTVHMTRHLAVYWARDWVRVNCLSPGPFPKDGGIPEEMRRRLETKSPLKRMGRPYELKGALLLLASDAGSYITGQNVIIDGGWTAW